MRQRTHALRARHVLVGALLVLATAGAVSAEEALGRNPLPVGALPRRPPGPVLARARADPPAPPPGGAPRLPPPRVRTLSPGRTVPGYPSPEPVPAGGTRAAGAGPGGTGPADGPLRPTPPPPRPATSPTPSPQDFVFGVDEVGGTILPLPDGKDRMVWVMMGNPRIQGFAHTRADGQRVDDLWIKANSVVVWLDLAKLGSLDALAGGGPAEGNGGRRRLPASSRTGVHRNEREPP